MPGAQAERKFDGFTVSEPKNEGDSEVVTVGFPVMTATDAVDIVAHPSGEVGFRQQNEFGDARFGIPKEALLHALGQLGLIERESITTD